jgi:hypothetical protein
VIGKTYEKLKTLVLKLKPNSRYPDLSSHDPDQLDKFVDESIANLQNTLISNTNDLRQRIKQARPDPDDPQYNTKMIAYKELLEQMIPIMQKLQNVIGQMLDELHDLVGQLWNDISKNDGNNIKRLLEEHKCRAETNLNEQWIKHIIGFEEKLNILKPMK